jgi:hypothetical protein
VSHRPDAIRRLIADGESPQFQHLLPRHDVVLTRGERFKCPVGPNIGPHGHMKAAAYDNYASSAA